MLIHFQQFNRAALLACSLIPLWAFSQSKPATEFTRKANEAFYQKLNFKDSADFADARRGFIATLDSGLIRNPKGDVVVNTNEYGFIKGEAPTTVNPSLWRQAQLNNINGLFKVTDGVYQVRSFDIAVVTFIRTNTGYLVIDPDRKSVV